MNKCGEFTVYSHDLHIEINNHSSGKQGTVTILSELTFILLITLE